MGIPFFFFYHLLLMEEKITVKVKLICQIQVTNIASNFPNSVH